MQQHFIKTSTKRVGNVLERDVLRQNDLDDLKNDSPNRYQAKHEAQDKTVTN